MRRTRNVVMLLGLDFMHPYLDPRVYKEAKSLVASGYEVSIVCWYKLENSVPASQEYEGIRVHRIYQSVPHPTTPLIWRLPAYAAYIFRSVKRCLGLKPDIVHCHDLDTLAIGVILKLFTRKALVFDAHEDFPEILAAVHSGAIVRLARFYEKALIRFADRVIAAELPYVEVMQKHYGITPDVVMNFPNLASFHPAVDPAPVIRKHGLENKIVISQIGGIGPDRGIYEMLQALSYLKQANIKFILIGKTTKEEKGRINDTVARFSLEDKVVLLLDGIPHEDTPMYYKASDISMALLYPTPKYVLILPTKMFESLAVGTPVLAGNLDYLSSIVRKYDVGLCADAKSPRDIAEKLDMMISDKEMRTRMGQNGLRAVREELNWGESEKKLLRVYDAVWTGQATAAPRRLKQ